MRKLKNKKGLTMLQVVATMVILIILSVIAVTNISKNVEESTLKGKQASAEILYEYVSQYIIEKGHAPIVDNSVNYKVKPALIDISKIAPDEEEKFKGKFYLYGNEHQVFYDYPPEYILKVLNESTNKSSFISGSKIDVQELHNLYTAKLPYKPLTSYVLLDNNKVQQVAN